MIRASIDRSNRYCTFHKHDYLALKRLIAEQEGLRPENVLLSHGSFEALTLLAVHFGSNSGEIIVPSPTFDVVGSIAKEIGAQLKSVNLDSDLKMNLAEMKNLVSDQTRLLTLCNPNNPTGTHIISKELGQFCSSVSSNLPVLVDEAYIHFLKNWREQTMAPLIAEGKNILITRTFSKIYGMAGLRIGFLMGPADLIQSMESRYTLGFPGNMPNSLSVAAAIGALQDKIFVDRSREKIEKNKLILYSALEKLEY